MARGTSLNELVTMVREEAGQSTNAALGQNALASLKSMIRRQQEVLWLEHPWPHMQVERAVTLAAGQRYYNFPADLSLHHRIDQVSVKFESEWQSVENGITLGHYNELDPDENERQDPVRCWELYEGNQLEVWPLPATNGGKLLLRGTRNLAPLVENDDLAELDDILIVMFVAAELAAKQNQENARPKLQIAQRHLTRLKAESAPTRVWKMGGERSEPETGMPFARYGKKL
jgi:uncharacterized membrane protein YkvA (DUF1232 family)